jgi:hypothetical protein
VSNLLIFCSLRYRTELNARISAPVDTAARATFSCSVTLKDNLFNFTAQSVSAILGEVGTSIAHVPVTKKREI